MSDETQPEPITYLLRHSGCISGPTECCFEVAIQKALNMPLGTEVVELYEWPEELITRLRADLAAVTAERDTLLARLAPVEDEELVEIVARAICLNRAAHACNCKGDGVCKAPVESLREHTEIWPQARAAIAAIRPHIEAAEREKWQKMLARMGAGTTKTGAVNE